jgi:predicted O-linked N-acetylglucosamine transferase (SPINDLY family)
LSIADAITQGMRLHQAGQLADAERIYRQVLAVEPNNAHVLHLLGTLALQVGQYAAAAELIGQAIRIDRSQAAFHANLGEVLRQQQQPAEAIASYQRAIKLQPDLAHAHAMIGSLEHARGNLVEAAKALREALRWRPDDAAARTRLGLVLLDQRQLPESEACFRRALRSDPNAADAQFGLGCVLQSQGKIEEAIAAYRAVVALDARHADAHTNLAVLLQQQKSYDQSGEHFRAALELAPQRASAHLNLGTNHQQLDRLAEAEACYRMALSLDPNEAAAHSALSSVLLRQGKLDDAVAAGDEAVRLAPESVAAHLNRAAALQAVRKLELSRAALEQVLRLEPQNVDALSNIGMIANEMGRRDEAIDYCRQALAIDPQAALPYNTIAVARMNLGQMDEAIAHARQASALSPAASPHHSNLLYMLNYHPGISPDEVFAEHRRWATTYADPLTAQATPHSNDRTPERRLRIGYVSAHFQAHAVNFFTEPILVSHDHQRFEVFCYANVDQPDETTERLKGYADHWRDVAYLSDEQAAALIRQDAIDILIDLTGHIGGNRLLVFARKPAPIQVTYIGYQNTTGMQAMDYRLTDDWSDPPGTDAHYTEKLVRLPRAFFCYQPSPDAPEVVPPPALDRGFVTFGSFNAFPKITPQVLETWAEILQALPDSRLVILGNVTPSLLEHIHDSFARRGIVPQRLTLADRRPRPEYLKLINTVDIALDPFPFNGHTTTCDSLWQGVPVVTLAGQNYVSRFGSSAHNQLSLLDLVAKDPREYVSIATGLASDQSRLQELRASLRDRMKQSPLLDFAGFTRNLEATYQTMWRNWCAIQHD